MPTKKKQPIHRGDENLVEVRAFIPKGCIVAGIVAQSSDGIRTTHSVHSVVHVFTNAEAQAE